MSRLAMLTTGQLASAIVSAKHLKSLKDYLPEDTYVKIDTLVGDLELEKSDRKSRTKAGQRNASL